MPLSQKEFDQACAEFTQVMRTVANWKHAYLGAAYTTRLARACNDAEEACRKMREIIRKDDG